MAVPFSDLQEINPGAVIELFKLELNSDMHSSTVTYRFHAGTSLNSNSDITWDGSTYERFPIEADGFQYSGNGQLPRPTIRVANLDGTITSLLLSLPSGLEGAKLTRIRTLARYLDAVNFPGNTNPYGTPDPTAEFPQEIYYIDRKVVENRNLVEFELSAAFDLAGVRAPKRQCIANLCPWIYQGTECGYDPKPSVAGTFTRKNLSATFSQSGTSLTVTSSSHGFQTGERAYVSRTKTANGTWQQTANTFFGYNPLTAVVTITISSHGFSDGDSVNLTFTSGSNRPDDGDYTVRNSTTNTFDIEVSTGTFTTNSGNVTAVLTLPSNFYTISSTTTNTFTVTSTESRTISGNSTINYMRFDLTAHGIAAEEEAYFFTNTDALTSGFYAPSAVKTNSMTFDITTGTTASGTVTYTQYFDRNDQPVTTSGSDFCGKRLSSCKKRFGETKALPFGAFPGIGTYLA